MSDISPDTKEYAIIETRVEATLKRTFWVSTGFTLIISIICLFGWRFDIGLAKSVLPGWAPMHLSVAWCMLMSAIALISIYSGQSITVKKIVPLFSGLLLLIINGIILTVLLTEKLTGREISQTAVPVISTFLSSDKGIPLESSIILFFIGVIILLFIPGNKRYSNIAHAICLFVSTLSYMIPTGYVLNIDSVMDLFGSPVSQISGIAFCALCLSIFTIRRDTWFMQVYSGNGSGGIMARKLIPWFIVLPLLIAWLRITGEITGLFTSETGVFLVAITYTVCFILLVWFTARSVNKIDNIRQKAVEDLRRSRDTMEDKVLERTKELNKAKEDLLTMNSQLERKISERTVELQLVNERLHILSETSANLLASDNPPELVNSLCLNVMKFLDCQVFFNYLSQGSSGLLHLNSYAGIPENTARKIEFLEYGITVCGCVAKDGKSIVAENIPETPDPRTDLVKSLGVKAYACHPLYSHDQVIGTLSFGTINRLRFSEDDLSLMKTVANQVAIAISRERDKELIRNSKDKLDIALENGRIGIWEWNVRTNSFLIDKRMAKILGIENGDFKGTFDAFEKNIHEEDLQHIRNSFNQSLVEGIPLETIFRVKRDNDQVNFITTKALLVKENGIPAKFTGVCFDITEMKKGAEKALFLLNEELLRSNRELEQFAYVASHDLQEPLRMVSSFTQLLSRKYEDKLDQNAQEYIQYAVDGATRMQVLINDLLDYSRISTRSKKYSVVNMHNILDQIIKNLSLKIREVDALVTIDELPSVVADEGQMLLLMQNLINNSLKFSKNSPRIHVSARAEPDKYIFSVKDNGIGIEKQYFDKIFQIFQRLHPKEEFGGTGIGLAICKRIVESHGGRIWLESKPHKGSIFYFTINKKNTYEDHGN